MLKTDLLNALENRRNNYQKNCSNFWHDCSWVREDKAVLPFREKTIDYWYGRNYGLKEAYQEIYLWIKEISAKELNK